ncbi:MAG: hypothetical protein ACOH18_02710 [Candidatus Saccharimonadaceae bacterium]
MIPTEPILFWQYFDVVVIVVLASTIFMIMKTHKSKTGNFLPSISQTIAADKRTSLLFSIVMTLCVPLYYAFLWYWVAPVASAPWYFYSLLLASFISEMVFTWFPATSGRTERIHQYSVGFVAAVMLVGPLMLLSSGSLNDIATVGVVIFVGISLILGILLLISRLRRHTLAIEITYCVTFLALISFIAHS